MNKEHLELYKIWLEKNEFNVRTMHSDFLVLILGFDKIEKIMRRTITTTSSQPHIKFYNYYLMDWYINERCPVKFNKVEYAKLENRMLYSNEDRKVEAEINEIKANVLIKDRPHFFNKKYWFRIEVSIFLFYDCLL